MVTKRTPTVDAFGKLLEKFIPDRLRAGDLSAAFVQFAPAPNGVDDTAALNTFLADHGGKTVTLRPGATYKTTSTLIVQTGTALDMNGATIDATGIPAATALGQRVAISSIGTKGAALPITTAIPAASRVVVDISSTAGLAVGDLVLIRNDESPVPGMTRTDRDKGELNVIQSIDSATQVTLTIATLFTYGAVNLVLEKIDPVKNVNIKGGKITLGGVGSGHCGIFAQYARNVLIEDVRIDGAEDTAVNLRTVWNGKVVRGKMENSTSSATLGTSGYGVCIVEGSRFCTAINVEFKNCRHFVTGGGYWPATDIEIKGCFGVGSLNAAYDTHESCFYWAFTGNRASGCAGGFGMRGQHVTVQGNSVYDCTGVAYSARTFDGVTEQRGIRFLNNEGVRCAGGLSFEGMAIGAEPNCLKIDGEATGNTLTDCGNATSDAMVIRHFDGMRVWANTVIRSGRHGALILGLSTVQSKNLVLGANHVSAAGQNGFDLQYIDNVSLSGGEVLSPVQHGLNVTTCNDVVYSAPMVKTPGRSGINITGGARHALNGPHLSGGTNNVYDAIRVSGSNELSIVGGYLGSARWAIFTSTTDNVVITGVNCRGGFSAGRISCDAANKIVANNLVT